MRLHRRAALGLGMGLALAGAGLCAGQAPSPEGRGDLRSRELVRMDCVSEIGARDVTLFANGTIRVRARDEGVPPRIWLGELAPDEVAAYENRFREIDLSEAESTRSGAAGEWVEQCRLRLVLFDAPERAYRFGRYDSLGLALSRVVRIVEELDEVALRRDARAGLPAGYQPQPGDLLFDPEGERFEVLRYPNDWGVIEIRAVDSPLLLQLDLEQIRERFVRLERSEDGRLP